MANPWNAFVTLSMSVPKVFTLSLIARMATSACSAALTVSPPSELVSAAAKPLTFSM